jgi:raffinose/stachyose/melibiose transport system substrate-binding protein
LRGECSQQFATLPILSRGTPNLENEMWNVSAQVLNGTMTPEAAGAQLEDGLKKWYAPHQK